MKKVAVTVAVLALGLAACNKNEADNNAANETAVENAAATDINAATDERDGGCRQRAERRRQRRRERRQRRRQRADAVANAAENATH